jgi:hypothetical protein
MWRCKDPLCPRQRRPRAVYANNRRLTLALVAAGLIVLTNVVLVIMRPLPFG